MPGAGLEPARSDLHSALNAACLPFHHPGPERENATSPRLSRQLSDHRSKAPAGDIREALRRISARWYTWYVDGAQMNVHLNRGVQEDRRHVLG